MMILTFVKEWFGREATTEKKKLLQKIKILLILALFVGLFWVIPIREVIGVIVTAQLNIYLMGLLLGFPMVYINAFELGILTRKQGVRISTIKLFAIHLVVKFYQLFLPGAIIGSGVRWLKISPKGKSIETLSAMAFYRLLDLFLVIAIGVFWFATGISQVDIDLPLIGLFFLGVIILWLLLTKGSLRLAKWLEHKPTIKYEQPILKVMWVYVRRLINAFAVYADLTSRELALLVCAGILSDVVSLISYIFIARSIGIGLSVSNLGWMRSVFLLASLTPLTIAGGLGIREVSFVIMMSTFDIEPEAALAFSLLLFSRTLFLSLTGAIIDLSESIYPSEGASR